MVSEVIARVVDRRRDRRAADGFGAGLSDDEASALERDTGSDDVRRSGLSEDED
jgi:hypothetical protein